MGSCRDPRMKTHPKNIESKVSSTISLPGTNIAFESGLEDELSFWRGPFSGAILVFREHDILKMGI